MKSHDWCYSAPSAAEIDLRGEDFRWKIGDVRGDGAACQELCNFIGEGVAVVLKQAIPVSSEDTAEENIRWQWVGSPCLFGMLHKLY